MLLSLSLFYVKKNGIYDAHCKECRKEKSRVWREENKDRSTALHTSSKECSVCKIAQSLSNFYYTYGISRGECKSCVSKKQKKYREAIPDIIFKRKKLYRAINKEKIALKKKQDRATNPEYYKIKAREWQQKNPEITRLRANRRRARKLKQQGHVCKDYMNILIDLFSCRCMFPGCSANDNLQVDHVIPLFLKGIDDISNLQFLCQHHNASKGARNSADYRPFQYFCDGC